METTDSKTGLAAQAGVSRRAFIRTTGLVAAAAGGIEGILAARQAPAFAQGTKLHIVRWVDFIPEAVRGKPDSYGSDGPGSMPLGASLRRERRTS